MCRLMIDVSAQYNHKYMLWFHGYVRFVTIVAPVGLTHIARRRLLQTPNQKLRKLPQPGRSDVYHHMYYSHVYWCRCCILVPPTFVCLLINQHLLVQMYRTVVNMKLTYVT